VAAEGNTMIAIAISVLWLLIGAIVLCGVIYLVLYGLKNIAGVPIPARVEQGVWFIVLIFILIAVLTILAGGGTSMFHGIR
jgi:hypothetical protein